jgi:hypothetical protein
VMVSFVRLSWIMNIISFMQFWIPIENGGPYYPYFPYLTYESSSDPIASTVPTTPTT